MNAETQRAILAATGRFIRRMLDPVEDRLKALEGRTIEKGDPGKDGEPGRDGKDGIDGKDGKSISMEEVAPILEDAIARGLSETEARATEIFQRALESIPVPVNGKDGINGEDGKSVTLEDVAPILQEAITRGLSETETRSMELVQRAIESIPTPENGKDGNDGRDGKDGHDGKSVSTEEVESCVNKALLSFERRAYDILQRSIEAAPKPKDGKDGSDGFGFDDLTVEHDGRRSFSFKFKQGERVKSFDFVLPLVLDAGFYQEGKAYEAGDGTTFGGSYWIAKTDTTEKPGAGSESWRLAVKKGRDGKVS